MRSDEPTPNRPDPTDHLLIRSYVPLLQGPPERVLGAGDPELLTLTGPADEYPTGRAGGLLWMAEAAGVHPVFLLDRADEIAAHLMAWSEDEPGKWFVLCFAERGEGFVVALVPHLVRSIERFETDRRAEQGRPAGAAGYDLMFRPIYLVCQTRQTLEQIRHLIPNPCRVGLLDHRTFADARPPSLALPQARPVGPVVVSWDERPFGYDMRPTLDRLFATEDSGDAK
jgi:hypothetical protein